MYNAVNTRRTGDFHRPAAWVAVCRSPGSDTRLRASAGSKAGGLQGGRLASAGRSGNKSRQPCAERQAIPL